MMMLNILITGKPGIGKTTVLNRVKEAVEDLSHSVGGVTCPEIRENGRRVGFNIVDVSNDKKGILAHVKCKGPHVGRYGVNLKDLNEIGVPAIENAVKSSDYKIENGEIAYPVKKAMISGNIFQLMKEASAASKKTRQLGSFVIPRIMVRNLRVVG
ncbi:MAG: metallopeptidase TldD-related protein [Methanobacterium paludis]|nr:metallopeptidase TldD-related protein [Methanobacterium paludis]